LQAVISKGTRIASKMKKFQPAYREQSVHEHIKQDGRISWGLTANPNASSAYRPAKRMKGDDMGR
jgi:hypothetical protein